MILRGQSISDVGNDAEIAFGLSDSILLLGLTAGDLTEEDFSFSV